MARKAPATTKQNGGRLYAEKTVPSPVNPPKAPVTGRKGKA